MVVGGGQRGEDIGRMNGFLVRDTRTKDFFPFRLGKSKKRTGLYWIHPVACKQTTNPVAFLSLFLILEDAGCEFFQENLSLPAARPTTCFVAAKRG